MGFSAGGHLSATASNNFTARTYPTVDDADKVSCRPDFALLIYPAYLTLKDEGDKLAPELNVTKDTPPTFLVMTQDDGIRVECALFYYLALKNAKGEARKLSDYAGQWLVLYFYPRDDTPGCTTEACEFTAMDAHFGKLSAKVVGVSPDTSERHTKFTDKYKLKVELLADPEKTALAAYGAYGKKMFYGKEIVGVLRSTVIVDPKGQVAHHFRNVKTAGHAAAVADRLRELQAAI